MHTVKYFEVFLYDKSPDSRTLPNFRVTLWKETKAFTALNNDVTELAGGRWIMNGNPLHDSFKIGHKGVPENYPVIHPFNRVRTSLPECP